jgi:hypothetical protein
MKDPNRKRMSALAGLIGPFVATGLLAQSMDTIDIPDVGPCPLVGTAKQDKLKELDQQKNRYAAPTMKQISTQISLGDMLKPGDDTERWDDGKAVEIVGYVIDVQPGGVETCNCKTKEEEYKDTHIAIVDSEGTTDKTEAVIVEVTPRVRMLEAKDGANWSTKQLKSTLVDHWVRFRGWMLFDFVHAKQSENINPGNPKNWRATAWEVHPVTDIQIVSAPVSARVSRVLRTLTFRPKATVVVDSANDHAYVSIPGQQPYPLLSTVETEDSSQ